MLPLISDQFVTHVTVADVSFKFCFIRRVERFPDLNEPPVRLQSLVFVLQVFRYTLVVVVHAVVSRAVKQEYIILFLLNLKMTANNWVVFSTEEVKSCALVHCRMLHSVKYILNVL